MKGKILGVAAEELAGAITGDDGKRYRYEATEWRGERAASIGASVDFDVEGGVARDVYPAVGAFAGVGGGATSVEALARSPGGERVISLFKNTLALPLALMVLVAFFLPALSSPVKTVSQLGLDKVVASTGLNLGDAEIGRRRLADLERDIARFRTEAGRGGAEAPDGVYGYGNVGSRLQSLEEQRTEIRKGLGAVDFLKTVNTALILRFAALIAAAWLIWQAWAGAALRPWELAAGAAAILAGGLTFLLKSAILGLFTAANPLGEAAATQMDSLVSIGIGPWLLLAAGAGLIASGLGLVRNPLARA
jgi:hypothetical protein